MSHTSMSQRLDAARKHAREEHQKGVDFHDAYSELPALFLAYIATLKAEAYDPSRTSPDLGIALTGGGGAGRAPRSNRAAAAELERLQAWMYREADRGMGRDTSGEDQAGNVGRIERLVYGGASTHTPIRAQYGAGLS